MFLRVRKTKREEKSRSDDATFALVATERASHPLPPILIDNSIFFSIDSRRCFQFSVYRVFLFFSAISKRHTPFVGKRFDENDRHRHHRSAIV